MASDPTLFFLPQKIVKIFHIRDTSLSLYITNLSDKQPSNKKQNIFLWGDPKGEGGWTP